MGLTAMTSMAAISSRILRDPRSAVMALPPAPAMRRAAATGAASRTMASTMAAPVADSAPSWRLKLPTWRAMTIPNGMLTSITGMLVTLAMNQHWRRYSSHQSWTRWVLRRPSRQTANMFPVSRTTVSTLLTAGDTSRLRREPLPARRARGPPLPRSAAGRPSDAHDLHVVVGRALDLAGLATLLLLLLERLLDLGVVLRHLVHPDRALGPAGQELA